MPGIALVGAGLAGSLLSIYLARRGFQVDAFERRPDMRKESIPAGRSINLALSTRGIHALRDVGIIDDIMKIAIPMKGRMIHATDGTVKFQRYGKDDTEVIYATSRGELNKALLSAAERQQGVRIHFNKRCTGMDIGLGRLRLIDELSGDQETADFVPVVGTDGSASALRMDMQKAGRFNLSQSYLEYGYKELLIPAGSDGSFLLEKNALHIWPRTTYMLIALPNIDGSFTVTFFFPFEGNPSFETLNTETAVGSFFTTQFPDAAPLMPTLVADFFSNPTGSMVTIKCSPWYVADKVALLGDAAHAIVPFFGQGMNCAFESCTILDTILEEKGPAWEEVFRTFEARRKTDTDAIADLAVENFFEMRDHVTKQDFQMKKKIEQALEARWPDRFTPKYSMVTFRRVPYSEALEKGRRQDRILDELAAGISNPEELDWEKADRLLEQLES